MNQNTPKNIKLKMFVINQKSNKLYHNDKKYNFF